MTLWFCHQNKTGYRKEVTRINLDRLPCPTVMAGGVNGDNPSHYWLEENGMTEHPQTEKPPYRVPSMAEIAAIEPNGFNVVSTFSGCGGSCLGYLIAGYRVLWANEFIPEARNTYKANHPDSILNTADIRQIEPQDILRSIGLAPGEVDVVEGSPPCASFSTAGKRESGWGKVKAYSDTKQRVDDLFFEFARVVRGILPKVFVAENVSGLVKDTAKGYFKMILKKLKECGYNVEARMLDAQWLGVPQMRQRIIFIGVRKDLRLLPAFPKPLAYRYSVRDALPYIKKIAHAGNDHIRHLQWRGPDTPSPSILQSDAERNETAYLSAGGFVEAETDISKYAIGDEWDKMKPGEKGKYLNFIKPEIDKPSPTVTSAGGNTSTASVVHPTEKRKFSIAELRQICGFPDDFILTGTYAQQWERLGRAVPPVMMAAIASTVRDEILCKLK